MGGQEDAKRHEKYAEIESLAEDILSLSLRLGDNDIGGPISLVHQRARAKKEALEEDDRTR